MATHKSKTHIVPEIPKITLEQKSHPEKKSKISNTVLAIASIFAIFLITYFVLTLDGNGSSMNTESVQDTDSTGLAFGVTTTDNVISAASCKLIIGQTTIHDDTVMSVSLEAGSSTYYSGYSISVNIVNDNGCVVDVNGDSDYLAIGQIERLGAVYVTVKDVVK